MCILDQQHKGSVALVKLLSLAPFLCKIDINCKAFVRIRKFYMCIVYGFSRESQATHVTITFTW